MRSRPRSWAQCKLALSVLLAVAVPALAAWAQGGGGGRPGRAGGAEVTLPTGAASEVALSAMAGCPTDRSVTISLLSGTAGEGAIDYGTASGQYASSIAPQPIEADAPREAVLEGLQPDTEYFYRLRQGDRATSEKRFHTQRAPGSSFTFCIQGDSHPERRQMFDPALYCQTLRAAAEGRPDFYLTIGDDFGVDTLQAPTTEAVDRIYRAQRWFLGLVGVPVFLVNGNHEQAALCNLDGTPDNIAVWAANSRNRYFPQPAPGGFYTGDALPVEHIGLLRDYYAWTWGDALFVVIDPYWHSPKPVDNVYGGGQKQRDLWNVTLGEEQYRWLDQTLRQSDATHKFVFAHHVHGTGRGGVEQAPFFEWGGMGRRGVSEFAQRRPGWGAPIHQLMAQAGVSIFFQGHDHIFVKQQLDGVVYQSLPLPADPYYALYNRDAYRTGDALPGSGHVRVTVSSGKVSVEYVRSYLPTDETADRRNGEIGYRYEIPPNR